MKGRFQQKIKVTFKISAYTNWSHNVPQVQTSECRSRSSSLLASLSGWQLVEKMLDDIDQVRKSDNKNSCSEA